MDTAAQRSPLTVNGRRYGWPAAPTVVVCIDGSEPDYTTEARAAVTGHNVRYVLLISTLAVIVFFAIAYLVARA